MIHPFRSKHIILLLFPLFCAHNLFAMKRKIVEYSVAGISGATLGYIFNTIKSLRDQKDMLPISRSAVYQELDLKKDGEPPQNVFLSLKQKYKDDASNYLKKHLGEERQKTVQVFVNIGKAIDPNYPAPQKKEELSDWANGLIGKIKDNKALRGNQEGIREVLINCACLVNDKCGEPKPNEGVVPWFKNVVEGHIGTIKKEVAQIKELQKYEREEKKRLAKLKKGTSEFERELNNSVNTKLALFMIEVGGAITEGLEFKGTVPNSEDEFMNWFYKYKNDNYMPKINVDNCMQKRLEENDELLGELRKQALKYKEERKKNIEKQKKDRAVRDLEHKMFLMRVARVIGGIIKANKINMDSPKGETLKSWIENVEKKNENKTRKK